MPVNPQLTPVETALQALARRGALPTNLDSAGLRALGAAFHENNLVSAQNNLAGAMDDFKTALEKILSPFTDQRPDRITPENPQGNVSTGFSQAEARMQIKDWLKAQGYAAAPEDRGTIKDLASDRRVNLFIQTNVELSQGRGWFIQSQDADTLVAFPGQELVRIETRKTQRDWQQRFRLAAQTVGDVDAARILESTGRMIARKDSPLWQALGDGAGGFEDTLGNPFPPFAFSSGMGVRDIGYTEAVKLGLLQPGGKVEPQPLDFAKMFAA